jgi:exopolyphosphatase/guanosine-5'-triphosphate,3'-diphosphate pyrophosphatase
LVFEQVLRAPISGMSHTERAFLALTAFCRHAPMATAPDQIVLTKVLSEDQHTRARALGAAMRLGCDLSGRSPVLLNAATLSITDTEVLLTAKAASADLLLGEQTHKRASALAQFLNRGLDIRAA